MLYAIIARDIPASQERRLASRPAHLARLEQLKEEGRLVLAGPHPAIDSNDPGAAGFTGSLIVAEFDSLAAAQSLGRGRPLPRRRRLRRSGGQAIQESPAVTTPHRCSPRAGTPGMRSRIRRPIRAGAVASSIQGVPMRPSSAHCLLLPRPAPRRPGRRARHGTTGTGTVQYSARRPARQCPQYRGQCRAGNRRTPEGTGKPPRRKRAAAPGPGHTIGQPGQ